MGPRGAIVDRSIGDDLIEIAFDPQTSGGLLMALSAGRAAALVDRLRSNGVHAATLVGYATAAKEVSVRLV